MDSSNEELVNLPVTVNKTPGFLTVLPEQLLFYEGSSLQVIKDTVSLQVACSDIVTQLQNTPKPEQNFEDAKFLLKLQVKGSKRPVTIAFIDPTKKEIQRNALRDALVPIIALQKSQRSGTPLSEHEAATRIKVLAANSDLAKLHKSLVQKGVITEDEFWETRKSLLLSESLQASQVRGAGSELLQEVKPQPTETQDVKVVLTADKIKAIFLQNPSVERAYADLVPDQLSEVQFWKRYFTSRFFSTGKASGSDVVQSSTAIIKEGGGSSELFDKYIAEIEASMDSDSIANQNVNRKVHVLLNLASIETAENDRIVGTVRPDLTMRPGTNKRSLSVIRKCNKLCEMVLKNSVEKGSDRVASTEGGVTFGDPMFIDEFDDLKPHEQPEPLPLHIENAAAYFQSFNVDADTLSSVSSPNYIPVSNAISDSRGDLVELLKSACSSILFPSDCPPNFSQEFLKSYESFMEQSPWPQTGGGAHNLNHMALPPLLNKLALEREAVNQSLDNMLLPHEHSYTASGSEIGAVNEFVSGIPAAVLLQASQLVANANELLHHFWAAWNHMAQSSAVENSSLGSKAHRMIKVIQQTSVSLDEFERIVAEAADAASNIKAKVASLFSSTRVSVNYAVELFQSSKIAQHGMQKTFPIAVAANSPVD